MFIQFRKHLEYTIHELRRIETFQQIDEEMIAPVITMIEIIESIMMQNYDRRDSND